MWLIIAAFILSACAQTSPPTVPLTQEATTEPFVAPVTDESTGDTAEAVTTVEAEAITAPQPTTAPAAAATATLTPLTGDLVIADAIGVGRIAETLAEGTMLDYPDANIQVQPMGTFEAMRSFCDGSISLVATRRPVSDELRQRCEANGIQFVGFPIALDAVVILVNANNADLAGVDCLTLDELAAILSPDSDVMKWSDIRADWPDQEISFQLHGPGNGWAETLMLVLPGMEDAARLRSDPNATQPVVQGVLDEVGNQINGFTYYAFKDFNSMDRPGLRALSIESESGACVQPTQASIQDRSYPLAHPLFLYVNSESLTSDPLVAGFIRYTLETGVFATVEESGYILLNPEDYLAGLTDLAALTAQDQ